MSDKDAFEAMKLVLESEDKETAQVWLLALSKAYMRAVAAKAARHMLSIGDTAMNRKQHAKWGYERRRREREGSIQADPVPRCPPR